MTRQDQIKVLILLVQTFIGASAYFDPWSSPSRDNFGFFNQGLQPCPAYKSMKLSNWEKMPTGDFVLRGAMPGVRSNARRVWLDESGGTLHIKALRPVPVQGRRCLPSLARISSDGRYEIFEASVALPSHADATGGTIKQTSYGFEILLPRLPTGKPRSSEIHAQQTRTNPTLSQKASHAQGQLRQPSVGERTAAMPKVPLEIPEGVEVIDVEPEEPMKNPDAAEGWYDNRGEFQLY
eukprot:gnl/MRDRNA2_/MRDRNA2_117611_c0_seq1.p1 gnl/MRDRNA2_/MRDRNA2_117611_c0~~gnl/MRDRNA2_/MRDRNA2_117611_c0_seq1.p1  ORF type:complete len:266 (+),score=40.79 gnl/MRDRNA2_/MRDRNA2_117611_c0_seq1:88-798(+)